MVGTITSQKPSSPIVVPNTLNQNYKTRQYLNVLEQLSLFSHINDPNGKKNEQSLLLNAILSSSASNFVVLPPEVHCERSFQQPFQNHTIDMSAPAQAGFYEHHNRSCWPKKCFVLKFLVLFNCEVINATQKPG